MICLLLVYCVVVCVNLRVKRTRFRQFIITIIVIFCLWALLICVLLQVWRFKMFNLGGFWMIVLCLLLVCCVVCVKLRVKKLI